MGKARKNEKSSATQRTDWGEVADWYDQLVGESGSEYHREVVLPAVLRLVGEPSGKSVVDLGCGQGVLSRILQQRGAQVTGVDAARSMIDLARQRSDPAVRYHVADAQDLSFLPEASFDVCTCVLAIQNMHPVGPVFSSMARLLKPMGRVALVMMHPCFRGAQETSWGWDEQAKVQYRRVDRYLLPRKTPIVTHPGKDASAYTWTFHKPLQDYIKPMARAGLMVDAMEELASHKTSTSGPRAAAENTARKEIPMFLALRAVKVGSTRAETDGE